MQTGPPLLDALQGDGVGNSDIGRAPQLFNPFLFQDAHVALELPDGAVAGPRGMNAGVEVCGDGLQSHLVKGEFYQSVYTRGGKEVKTSLFLYHLPVPDLAGAHPPISGSLMSVMLSSRA